MIDAKSKAKMISLVARKNNDEEFTSEHLEVIAEIGYPDSGVTLQYRIWAYPGAPGIRTQLWVKGSPTDSTEGNRESGAGPSFKVMKGGSFTNSRAKGLGEDWAASMLVQGDAVCFACCRIEAR